MKVVGKDNERSEQKEAIDIDSFPPEKLKQIIINQQNYIQQIQIELATKRVDYMLRIISLKDAFSDKFIEDCVREVEQLMTINHGVQ